MFTLIILLVFTSIVPLETYASAGDFYLSPENATAWNLLNGKEYPVYQQDDTLSVSDSEVENGIPGPEVSVIDELTYTYSLVTVSFTVSFLLVLILILLSYQFRFSRTSPNMMSMLFIFLLLVNCATFYIPDLFEIGDQLEVATPYIWFGTISLAIHLLPYLVSVLFKMRRLRKSKYLIWFAVLPLVSLFLELDYHIYYLAAAFAVATILGFYFLYKAADSDKVGVNYLLAGIIGTLVISVVFLPESRDIIDLEMSFTYIAVALIYIILPLSLTLCISQMYLTDYSVMESELQKLSTELKSANERLQQLRSHLDEHEQFVSLGRLSVKIAREIKNPVDLVINSSEESIRLIKKAQNELVNSPHFQDEFGKHIHHLLLKIEEYIQKIREQGSQAGSKVTSMFEQPDTGNRSMQPTDLNDLIEEYVNLARRSMLNGKNPVNVEIDMNFDKNVGSIPLIADDFSRVILSLCKNAFDAMRIRMGLTSIDQDEQIRTTGFASKKYVPRLSIYTKREDRIVSIKMEYNAPEVPSEVRHNNILSIFDSKNDTTEIESGISLINKILRAHDSEILIVPFGDGTSVQIELRA